VSQWVSEWVTHLSTRDASASKNWKWFTSPQTRIQLWTPLYWQHHMIQYC
jgi:hypothetical protein